MWRLLPLLGKTGEFAKRDHEQYRVVRTAYERHRQTDLESARLLEVGCGTRHGVTLLFHSAGASIVGIDSAHQALGLAALSPLEWRRRGATRTLQNALRAAVFDGRYYAALEREFGRPLRRDSVDVRAMEVEALDFPDQHFDFVFSTAVFEHLADVPSAAREIARVLKPGGFVFLSIHLFPGISGGHNLEWSSPQLDLQRSCPPWDHLLESRYPARVYLNRLRERDYVRILGEHFDLLASDPLYEGERYLTPAIADRLRDYSRDELLKTSVNLHLRKPSSSPVRPAAAAGRRPIG